MMKIRNYAVAIITVLVIAILQMSYLHAQTETEEFAEADGIKRLSEDLWIFPDNQVGNSLYFEKTRVLTREGIQITDAEKALDGFLYLGLDENGEYQLGFAGNSESTFTALEGGFYYLVSKDRGKKRYYWITDENKIQNMLPRYNTAAGLVFNGINKAAFYHISKGETIEQEDGTLKYQYTFRIHVADRLSNEVRHIPDVVTDFYHRLKLEWIQPDELKYTILSGDSGYIETW